MTRYAVHQTGAGQVRPYYINVKVTSLATCNSPTGQCFTGLVTQTTSAPWQLHHDGRASCPQ